MDRKNFYDQQNVRYNELNDAFADAEASDQNLVKEAIGYGITEGFTVASVGSNMAITWNGGSLIDKTGQRVKVNNSFTQSFASDSLGNPVAVGVGNERWLSVFGRISRWKYDVRQIGGTNVNDGFQAKQILSPVDVLNTAPDATPPTPSFFVVSGTEAPLYSAQRSALSGIYILICDLYVTHGQTDFNGAGAIDFQRSELLRRVEPSQALRSLDASGSAINDFSLINQTTRGHSTTRWYIGHAGGLMITVNAEKVPSDLATAYPKWKADDYSKDSLAFCFGTAYGAQGSPFAGVVKVLTVTGGSKSAPWDLGSWTPTLSLPA